MDSRAAEPRDGDNRAAEPRTVGRRAVRNTGGWLARAAVTAATAFLGSACGGAATQPAPSKPSEQASLADPAARPARTGGFQDPRTEPPGARTPQLTADKVEATLAEARRLITAGRPQHAVPVLYRCANKTPASARCDGELGIVLANLGKRRAHMRYFLAQAAKTDDPNAAADFYRRVAAAARKRGLQAPRADAVARLVGRGEATAADYYEQAQALSTDADRIHEAIGALATAYAKDPTQHGWLLERAVLAAQTQDWAAAVTLLESYLDVAPTDAPMRRAAKKRLILVQAKLGSAPQPARD